MEHLTPEAGKHIVKILTQSSDVILFSSAMPSAITGSGHINEQWAEYWIELFKNEDFDFVDNIRPRFWDNDGILWWHAQNTFIFINNNLRGKYFDENLLNKFQLPAKIIHHKCIETIEKQQRNQTVSETIKIPYIRTTISDIAQSKKKYALWGAGKHTKWFLDICKKYNLQQPLIIVDDFTDLSIIESIPIIHSDLLNEKIIDIIYISSDHSETIGKIKNNIMKKNINNFLELYK